MTDRAIQILLLVTLVSLQASLVRAQQYYAFSTYLNVYLSDGTASTIHGYSPTVSPYSPTVETIQNTTGIGMPLTDYGPLSWLQSSSSWPGPTSASFSPAAFSTGKATGQVVYNQGSFYMGTNTLSTTTVSPYGTSLSLSHTGSGIAELRLDWTTTYLYVGPLNTWSGGTTYNYADMITDGNGNAELCVTGGASGPSSSGPPTWAVPGVGNGKTSDGTVTWLLLPMYVPQGMNLNISGTLLTSSDFIAVTGQETFSKNGVPISTVTIPWAGDFLAGPSTLPTALTTGFLDSGLLTASAPGVFGSKTAGTFFETVGTYGPTPVLIQDSDLVTVSGYVDLFVDPAAVQVRITQPTVPSALGITNTAMGPAVYFPMITPTNHTLQTSTNLLLGNWTTVTNGTPTMVTDSFGQIFGGLVFTNKANSAFFRLH